MKFILTTILLITTSFVVSAQNKFAVIEANDPIVGEWQWIGGDTGAPASPFPEEEWRMIKFVAGNNQSVASAYDEGDGEYQCPNYFLAFTNGKQMTGTVSDCCIKTIKGKKFTFDYRYDYAEDQLTITVRGVSAIYKRRSS